MINIQTREQECNAEIGPDRRFKMLEKRVSLLSVNRKLAADEKYLHAAGCHLSLSSTLFVVIVVFKNFFSLKPLIEMFKEYFECLKT